MAKVINCLFCTYYRFEPFHPGYSEYTPGNEAGVNCLLGYWSLEDFDTQEEYMKAMYSAMTCEKFKVFDEALLQC